MSAIDPDETYLTVAEVAETLKLNQQTVRNWIEQGSLPALRVGRRVRIRRSDFQRILEESYSPGTAAAEPAGPSAEDFWGGGSVGLAEPAPGAATSASAAESSGAATSRAQGPASGPEPSRNGSG